MFDIATGLVVGSSSGRRIRFVHARGHVPAFIAYWLWRFSGIPFLFDHRGRMAADNVDAGIWPADGFLYRMTSRWGQRGNQHAACTVELTARLRSEFSRCADRAAVMTCAVDLARIRL